MNPAESAQENVHQVEHRSKLRRGHWRRRIIRQGTEPRFEFVHEPAFADERIAHCENVELARKARRRATAAD